METEYAAWGKANGLLLMQLTHTVGVHQCVLHQLEFGAAVKAAVTAAVEAEVRAQKSSMVAAQRSNNSTYLPSSVDR